MNQEARIQKLIATFAEEARKHYDATMRGDWRQTNQHAKRIAVTFHAVTDVGNNARDALLRLTEDQDDAVASMAALYSLKYATSKALAALSRISKRSDLLGFEAQQAIQRWHEGTWQLE
jgi:hypothetical protein